MKPTIEYVNCNVLPPFRPTSLLLHNQMEIYKSAIVVLCLKAFNASKMISPHTIFAQKYQKNQVVFILGNL
jgi:hypothetical protein